MNVGLGSILDADKSEFELDLTFVEEKGPGISASVHDIDFGDAADGPLSKFIDLPGHVQNLVVSDVLVGWNNAQDDGIGIFHVPSLWVWNTSLSFWS